MTECNVIISNRKTGCRVTMPIKVRTPERPFIPPDTPRICLQDKIEEDIKHLFGDDWVLVTWGQCCKGE